MLVFNNQQRSGYEEIVSYSPRYYRNIKEMDAVFRLAGWLIDLMAQDMENMVAFQFLKYMDDETLTRYEAFLGMAADRSKTLEERKDYVSAVLIGSGKVSADKISGLVNQFSGCICEDIVLVEDVLHIRIVAYEDRNLILRDEIFDLIRQKVPSHIEMSVIFDRMMAGKIHFGCILQETDIIEIKEKVGG